MSASVFVFAPQYAYFSVRVPNLQIPVLSHTGTRQARQEALALDNLPNNHKEVMGLNNSSPPCHKLII